MAIVSKIIQAVEAASGLRCYYDNVEGLNVLLDNVEFPCVYMELLQNSQVENDNGNWVERADVAIVVCDKTDFDADAAENEQIIERCKNTAVQIAQMLGTTGEVALQSINSGRRFYQEFDVILTGYAINLNVQEVYGVTGCDIEPTEITITENGVYDVKGVQVAVVNVSGECPPCPPCPPCGFSLQDFIDNGGKFAYHSGIYATPYVDVFKTLDFSGANFQHLFAYSKMESFVPWKIKAESATPQSLGYAFYDVSGTEDGGLALDLSEFHVVASNMLAIFYNSDFSEIDFTGIDTSRCANFGNAFRVMKFLRSIDLSGLNFAAASNVANFLSSNPHLVSLIGSHTLDEVLSGDIAVCVGLSINLTIASCPQLERASLRAIINGVADRTGAQARTLTIGAALQAKLTTDDIEILTNKNWNLA